MSEIFVSNSGVQSQSGVIINSTNGAEQSSTIYTLQSSSYQVELDGAARFNTLQFITFTRVAIGAACATTNNINTFIRNAAQTTTSVDRSQSQRFISPH